MVFERFPEPTKCPEWSIGSLGSALTAMPATECPDPIWVSRIAALANAAKDFPERTEALRRLAIDWSSGKLQQRPVESWTKPGPDAGPRMDRFDALWERYLSSNYQGKRVTVLSIFFDARKIGWRQEAQEGNGTDGLEVTGT